MDWRCQAVILVLVTVPLGSCSYDYVHPIDVVQRDGKILIWTKPRLKWFIIPQREAYKVNDIQVWSDGDWSWRVTLPYRQTSLTHSSGIPLPVVYGATLPQANARHGPKPLRPNKLYYVAIDTSEAVSFRVSTTGKLVDVRRAGLVPDPDQLIAAEATDRTFRQLRASGLSEEEALKVIQNDSFYSPNLTPTRRVLVAKSFRSAATLRLLRQEQRR